MKERIQYKGMWFLPSARDKRISGILIYDPNDGISLELFGNIRKDNSLPSICTELTDEDAIQGITNDSREITLFGCLHTNGGGMSFKAGCEIGEPLSSYHVRFMLEGIHAENQETLKLQKIKGRISNLDEWLGISGFSFPNSENYAKNNYIVDVRYTLPNQISFEIDEKFEGCFNFGLNGDTRSRFQKNVALNQYVEVIITAKENCTFNELLDCLSKFQNFLILALYVVPPLESIELLGEDHVTCIDDRRIQKSIKLFFNQSYSNQIKIKHDYEMIFGYAHIEDDFSAIISKWYERYELLKPICGMLFRLFDNDNFILENRFLNLAQSIETFHSKVHHNRKKIDDIKFKKMKEDILATVSTNYHDWLKGQFDFGNNLDLHTRLMEMVEKYSSDTLMQVIGNKEAFIKQIKDSRNYYTHYNPTLEKKALKGKELFHLTEKLKILLVSAFLIEVGFEKEKIDVLLK